jgi:hypothetical protein
MARTTSETVQRKVHSLGTADSHGNKANVWANPVDVAVYAFDPGTTTEPRLPGQQRVITTPTLYFPDGTVFAPQDRVIARGKEYEVDGETEEWRHPNGQVRGNVVALRRVTG